MLPIPNWLLRERVLAHLVGGGLAAALGTAWVLIPLLRDAGIATWPGPVQDVVVTVLGATLVYGPAIAVLGLAMLLHIRSTAD